MSKKENKRSPAWAAALEGMFCGDQEQIRTLQEFMGYVLLDSCCRFGKALREFSGGR